MAAPQISINTQAASDIYQYAKRETEDIRQQLAALDKKIDSLLTEGEWKGAAADKFFDEYNSVRETITVKTPEVLDQISDNLDRNLRNLVEADTAGA